MGLKKNDRFRDLLAQEAAKIIATEGVRGYQLAKRKAFERIGNSYHGSLPSNFEVERAIFSYHNTFSLNHELFLTELRNITLVVMQWFEQFSPYLVGSVLDGTANPTTPITIHVSSDTIESIMEVLQQQGVNINVDERRLKINGEASYLPTLIFIHEACEVEVIVFTLRQQHQNPKSKSKNKSMRRMNINLLKKCVHQSSDKPNLAL